jgi:hypothetical protein
MPTLLYFLLFLKMRFLASLGITDPPLSLGGEAEAISVLNKIGENG